MSNEQDRNGPSGDADRHNDEPSPFSVTGLNCKTDPEADYEPVIHEGKVYNGSLTEDCLSVYELGLKLEAQMREPAGENIFEAARRRNKEQQERNQQLYESLKHSFGERCARHLLPDYKPQS